MKNQNMFNHQDTKGTRYNENHVLIKALNQIFFVFLGALGVLVVKMVWVVGVR